MKGLIYFVTIKGDSRFVKIGYVKNEKAMKQRMVTLQVGNPFELQLEGIKEGTVIDECELHWHFFEQWFGMGEWFLLNDEIRKIISTECRQFSWRKQKKHRIPNIRKGALQVTDDDLLELFSKHNHFSLPVKEGESHGMETGRGS